MAKQYATKNIVTTKWKLFPVYMGRKIVRVRIGSIHPEFNVERILTAIDDNLQEEYKIVTTSVTQVVYWWGYDCEVFLAVSEDDWKK